MIHRVLHLVRRLPRPFWRSSPRSRRGPHCTDLCTAHRSLSTKPWTMEPFAKIHPLVITTVPAVVASPCFVCGGRSTCRPTILWWWWWWRSFCSFNFPPLLCCPRSAPSVGVAICALCSVCVCASLSLCLSVSVVQRLMGRVDLLFGWSIMVYGSDRLGWVAGIVNTIDVVAQTFPSTRFRLRL